MNEDGGAVDECQHCPVDATKPLHALTRRVLCKEHEGMSLFPSSSCVDCNGGPAPLKNGEVAGTVWRCQDHQDIYDDAFGDLFRGARMIPIPRDQPPLQFKDIGGF